MLKMQQRHRVEQQYDDEKLIHMKKAQVRKVEEEKGKAFNELREMKKIAEETNLMVDEALATKGGFENNNQSSISNTREQNGVKDSNNNIDALEHESSDSSSLEKLKKEMNSLRSSEANAMSVISDYKRKVQELEEELEKRKESESNLFDTLVMQTKQLEQSKVSLEESKILIGSLEAKTKALQGVVAVTQNKKIGGGGDHDDESKVTIWNSISTKENSGDCDCDGEELSKKAEALIKELNEVRGELKSATKAEEDSKKAMDDLAFALKEVATEANQVKAKLTLSQVELEHTKGDAERWRAMLESTEEKYKELLDVTRKEADRYKNTAERLRLEAEESHLAWNGKETEFVSCIKRSEEERLLAQEEITRLLKLLKEAENKIMVSKDENQKLRDILKQALNEANVAKEAAEIAKAENARLQDSLTLLVQENEMLKIHEAASFDNIRELKRMLSESSSKEFKIIEDIQKPSSTKEGTNKEDKESSRRSKNYSLDQKEHKETKNLSKTFSFNLKDMISPHKPNKVGNEEQNKDAYFDEDDTLKGSIFDDVDSSDSESMHHDAEIMGTPDELDHLDESPYDDSESERNSRKRRALLRRFGDLIRRKSSTTTNNNFRKEPSNIEEHVQT